MIIVLEKDYNMDNETGELIPTKNEAAVYYFPPQQPLCSPNAVAANDGCASPA